MIYVGNFGPQHQSVTTYPVTANGDYAPTTTIEGSKTRLSGGPIAVDSSGAIYVAERNSFGIGRVLIFAAGSNGNIPPTHVLTGPATGLIYPTAIAFNSAGDLFVANYSGGGNGPTPLLEFAPEEYGNAKPIAVISSIVGIVIGIAFDSKDDIYVAEQGNRFAGVAEYPAGSDGNVPPTRTISGALTLLQTPCGLAIGALGDIRVTDCFLPEADFGIHVFGPTQHGDVAPLGSIAGQDTEMHDPRGIAVGLFGNSYVAEHQKHQILIYHIGARGDASPIQDIGGKDTGLYMPWYVAIH
jgi:hypothetical protein